MYMLVGTDENGREVFVDQRSKIHVKLDSCAHCGRADVMSGDPLTQLCEDCQKRYNYFYTQKRQLTRSSKPETMLRYKLSVEFFIKLRDAGINYKVPSGLDNELERVDTFIESYVSGTPVIKAGIVKPVEQQRCKGCGALVDEGVQYGHGVRCGACEAMYKRYQYFLRRMNSLTSEECDEMDSMLDTFKFNGRRGWWMPNIDDIRKRVQRRRDEL